MEALVRAGQLHVSWLSAMKAKILCACAKLAGTAVDRRPMVAAIYVVLIVHAVNNWTVLGLSLGAIGALGLLLLPFGQHIHAWLLRVAAAAQLKQNNSMAAEQLLQNSITVAEGAYGKRSLGRARAAKDLAELYVIAGAYAEAEDLFNQVKKIEATKLGLDHHCHATTMMRLAEIYQSTGRYEQAERFLVSARGTLEKRLGEQNSNHIRCVTSLASLYTSMQNYSRAREIYQHLRRLQEQRRGGRRQLDYATTLCGLATVYHATGRTKDAETLHQEAEWIRFCKLGKNHPDYAAGLNNMATFYKAIDNHPKARSLYMEARAIWAQTVGTRHPDYATCLNNLAGLLVAMGSCDEAETMYLEAKESWAELVGERHPNFATVLSNLARLYAARGDLVKAETLYIQAKDIQAEVLGKQHPSFLRSVASLAEVSRMKEEAEQGGDDVKEKVLQEALEKHQPRCNERVHDDLRAGNSDAT